jgi:hypothetical protein
MMKEIMIQLPGEAIIGEIKKVVPISGIYNLPEGMFDGKLIYTNYRVSFIGIPYKNSKNAESRYYFMVPFERLLSVSISQQKSLFGLKKNKKLMVHYETIDGIVRKAYFKVPWEVPDDVVNDITSVVNRAKENKYHESLIPPQEFREFVLFLYSEKGISPLYHDPVSRAVKIGNATFYIKKDFVVEGDSHILPDAERWIKEFISLKGRR